MKAYIYLRADNLETSISFFREASHSDALIEFELPAGYSFVDTNYIEDPEEPGHLVPDGNALEPHIVAPDGHLIFSSGCDYENGVFIIDAWGDRVHVPYSEVKP